MLIGDCILYGLSLVPEGAADNVGAIIAASHAAADANCTMARHERSRSRVMPVFYGTPVWAALKRLSMGFGLIAFALGDPGWFPIGIGMRLRLRSGNCCCWTSTPQAPVSKSADLVIALTEQVIASGKLTTLMVTHSMHQAASLGDRLIMMHRGHDRRSSGCRNAACGPMTCSRVSRKCGAPSNWTKVRPRCGRTVRLRLCFLPHRNVGQSLGLSFEPFHMDRQGEFRCLKKWPRSTPDT